jgi:hypothetical protein
MIKRRGIHRNKMKNISLDERLHPNLRFLAELLSMIADSDGDEQQLFKDLLRARFITKSGVRWQPEKEDEPEKLDRSQATLASKDIIKGFMDNILQGETENASNV